MIKRLQTPMAMLALVALVSANASPVAPALLDPTLPRTGAGVDAQAGQANASGLQSVKIPKKGAPVALIGGQSYKVGDMVGEARLVRLTEKEAVLEGPDGIERLPLTPGIEKTNITRKPAASAARSRSKP